MSCGIEKKKKKEIFKMLYAYSEIQCIYFLTCEEI